MCCWFVMSFFDFFAAVASVSVWDTARAEPTRYRSAAGDTAPMTTSNAFELLFWHLHWYILKSFSRNHETRFPGNRNYGVGVACSCQPLLKLGIGLDGFEEGFELFFWHLLCTGEGSSSLPLLAAAIDIFNVISVSQSYSCFPALHW